MLEKFKVLRGKEHTIVTNGFTFDENKKRISIKLELGESLTRTENSHMNLGYGAQSPVYKIAISPVIGDTIHYMDDERNMQAIDVSDLKGSLYVKTINNFIVDLIVDDNMSSALNNVYEVNYADYEQLYFAIKGYKEDPKLLEAIYMDFEGIENISEQTNADGAIGLDHFPFLLRTSLISSLNFQFRSVANFLFHGQNFNAPGYKELDIEGYDSELSLPFYAVYGGVPFEKEDLYYAVEYFMDQEYEDLDGNPIKLPVVPELVEAIRDSYYRTYEKSSEGFNGEMEDDMRNSINVMIEAALDVDATTSVVKSAGEGYACRVSDELANILLLLLAKRATQSYLDEAIKDGYPVELAEDVTIFVEA